jgi:hypothetical protein
MNEGHRDLQFWIKPSDGEWTIYTAASGKGKWIACNSCLFSIATDDKLTSYSLDAGEKYFVKWDAS